MQFLAEAAGHLGLVGCDVLEVGSAEVNSSMRGAFTGRHVGIDLGVAPGVQVVADGARLPFATGAFEVTMSAECFEHNPRWRATLSEMVRVASLAVLVTCASTGRPEHGTARTSPDDSALSIGRGWDFYHNVSITEFAGVIDLDAVFASFSLTFNPITCDLYFWGLLDDDGPPQ